MTQKLGLCIAGLLLLARTSFCQYGYNYDANYYDDYSLYNAGDFPRLRWMGKVLSLDMHASKETVLTQPSITQDTTTMCMMRTTRG